LTSHNDAPSGAGRVVAAAARGLLPDSARLAEEVADRCAREIPDLGRQELWPTVLSACEANVTTMLTTLTSGHSLRVEHAPPGALALAREMVHLGADLSSVLRGYRLGHAWFMDVMIDALPRHSANPSELGTALVAVSRWLFEYIDAVSNDITAEFEGERARWLATTAALRDAAIRGVLADPQMADTAGRTLGYDLAGLHVALIAWLPEPGDLAGMLHRYLADQGIGRHGLEDRPLVHTPGPRTAWIWTNAGEPLELSDPPGALRLAIGSPRRGPEGFRGSHCEAQQAHRVAMLNPPAAPPIVHFRDVEIVALLTGGTDEAALSFLKDELGSLVEGDRKGAQLRETALAIFETDSITAAAHRLGIHHNTVINRVRQIEMRRGRPLSQDRLRLHAALHLAAVLKLPE
jgi:hypothetical protein